MDGVYNLAIGWIAYNLYILDVLEEVTKLGEVFPLGVVELQKLLLFDEFVI